MKSKMKLMVLTGATVLAATLMTVRANDNAGCPNGTNWLAKTISPVANPIYFEDANITSEVHPVYMWHNLPNTFDYAGGTLKLGGQVQVIAAQLRYALNDRLAIIATKDGYIQFQPGGALHGAHAYGWADLAAGLKYAIIKNNDAQFILTPGFTVTIPTGNRSVYQGHGAGVENIFVSAEKGFGRFHVLGNVGFLIPNDFAADTAQAHYSLQLDYYVHQYFIPFVALNGYTVLSSGSHNVLGAPLQTEGYDLINFGSTQASGRTMLTVGGGFRTRLLKNLDAGVAYEGGIVQPVGIFESRVTADVIWRF